MTPEEMQAGAVLVSFFLTVFASLRAWGLALWLIGAR